ncbi:MAG TPA: glycosyltransferase family 39 protein, partial [Polyangiaceae bacterium]|nr:glycosyltransferase family 39 protein [Polyangiaceae bacterium]
MAVACVVLLSLAFRLHVSHECSLWLDEVSTHVHVLQSWPKVLYGPEPQHPPLMFVLVKVATNFLGTGETAMRSVSLFFGCILLVAVYDLCLELGLTVRRSVIVVSTLALSPFFIRHATEARQYAMFTAFSTLATARALRLLRGPVRTRDLVGFAINAVAAAATQYFGLAYALALLGSIAIGVAQQWKQTAMSRRLAAVGTLLGCLVPLGYLTLRAAALGRTYAVGEIGATGGPAFNSELLQDYLHSFSFLTNELWSVALQPGLTLVGLVLLSRQLRGVARTLPLGLGLVPCVAALFMSGQHFIAARYLAPSAVFYHLGACVALFAAVDRIRLALARGRLPALLAPYVGGFMLIGLLAARLREYPDGFGAGEEDYRALQRYFRAELARDTALVAYPGFFGELLLHKEYNVGTRLISLEKFRPLPGVNRYLIVEVAANAERHAEAGA